MDPDRPDDQSASGGQPQSMPGGDQPPVNVEKNPGNGAAADGTVGGVHPAPWERVPAAQTTSQPYSYNPHPYGPPAHGPAVGDPAAGDPTTPSGQFAAMPPGQPYSGAFPTPGMQPGPNLPYQQVPQYVAPPIAPPQMWLPPGDYLPPSTWRKRWKVPVIVGSSIVGVLLAVVTVFAIGFGTVASSVFTAKGAVMVNCQTSTALAGMIHAGDTVQIWGETGTLEATTTLGGVKKQMSSNQTQVCFLPFAASDVSTSQVGFDVRIGIYRQFVSANALKRGAVLRPGF